MSMRGGPTESLHFYVVWRKCPPGEHVTMHVSNLWCSREHVKKNLWAKGVLRNVLFYVVR